MDGGLRDGGLPGLGRQAEGDLIGSPEISWQSLSLEINAN